MAAMDIDEQPGVNDKEYEIFLSIAPQGHAAIRYMNERSTQTVLWNSLPSNVSQVILSTPNMEWGEVKTYNTQCKNVLFHQITAYDVDMVMTPSVQFIDRVRTSTSNKGFDTELAIARRDQTGVEMPWRPMSTNMVVSDITDEILSEGGMNQKTFIPFQEHDQSLKQAVENYRTVNEEGIPILNVIVSWSIRRLGSMDEALLKGSNLYQFPVSSNGTLLLSEIVDETVNGVIRQIQLKNVFNMNCQRGHPLVPFVSPRDGQRCDSCQRVFPAGTTMKSCRPCDYDLCADCETYKARQEISDKVTFKVAVHDFLCSEHQSSDGTNVFPRGTVLPRTKGGKKTKGNTKRKRNTKGNTKRKGIRRL
jgi:hypothetical protein